MNLADVTDAELESFLDGSFDPKGFDHAGHLRIAYALLQRQDFEAALLAYAMGLRRLLARVGHPEKYHSTITTAFITLVATRMESEPSARWANFAATHPDLFDTGCLVRWYRPETLSSWSARQHFVMPDRNALQQEIGEPPRKLVEGKVHSAATLADDRHSHRPHPP